MKIWSLDFDELVVSKLFRMIEKISLCAWNNDIFQSNIQFFLKLIFILKIYYWGKKYNLVGLVVNQYWKTSCLFLSLCPSVSHPLRLLPLLPMALHSFSPFLSLLRCLGVSLTLLLDLTRSLSLLPPPPYPVADGPWTIHYDHRRHPHTEAREPVCLQNWHLWLEKALSVLICSSFTHHPPRELCSYNLDS